MGWVGVDALLVSYYGEDTTLRSADKIRTRDDAVYACKVLTEPQLRILDHCEPEALRFDPKRSSSAVRLLEEWFGEVGRRPQRGRPLQRRRNGQGANIPVRAM